MLNDGDDGLGHFRGATDRVIAAIKIVAGNQRVDDKAGLGGDQAVIAPLAGKGGDQFLITGKAFEYLLGGAIEEGRRLAVG